ncbi:cytidylyltransferase domain-containing protein [Planctomycetota bacterium]
MKIAIILQARMGSQRLPEKILKELQGIPLLCYGIRRLKKIGREIPLIVATSTLPQDDRVEDLANSERVLCFRGSEDDVLERFYGAAIKFEVELIIRATGDNPLVDTEEAERVGEEINSGRWDYVSGFEQVNGQSLPIGAGVEAFTFSTLELIRQKGLKQEYREHINDYVFDNPGQFRVKKLPCLSRNNCPDLRLTVDTIEDFEFIERIGREINIPLVDCTTKDIIDWWASSRNA